MFRCDGAGTFLGWRLCRGSAAALEQCHAVVAVVAVQWWPCGGGCGDRGGHGGRVVVAVQWWPR